MIAAIAQTVAVLVMLAAILGGLLAGVLGTLDQESR